ncbi:MAG: urease-associated protein [Chitinophagaceae bacterium]|nr:urease-associated protein [Chitinophagaceae bacterium]
MIYLLYVLALIPLYFIVAFLLSYIPYNRSFTSEKEHPILVQLHSNGVHTDILLPVENSIYNWHSFLPDIPAEHNVVAFGWGDKGFYLNTPTWDDLTFSTAFKACTGLSTTAMHVSYYKGALRPSEHTVSVFINAQQYQKLVDYIQASFQHDANGKLLLVKHDPRYYSGQFYDAKGRYSLFTSCNSWVNKGLKKSELKTCLWTPFDWPLLNPYK